MEKANEKAALYVRVSTHYQVDKDSLPFQRKELINYCKYVLNIKDFEIFEDAGYSGGNTDRPKYQEMISRIRDNEFTHLMVWKIDRISRNLLDFAAMYEELKKYNVTFVSKNEQFDTSSAMGEAMLKIILIFAELERKLTAERVRGIMLSRAEKGLWNGAPTPLGYDYDEDIEFPVVNKEEAQVVKFIFDKYEELKSAGEVKHQLEKAGLKTKRDRSWGTKVIGDTIKNIFYTGTYRYNYRYSPHGKIRPKSEWIIVEDNHDPIISKEQFNRCQDIMNSNAGYLKSTKRRKVHIHVFSGLVSCPSCNTKYVASADRPRVDGYAPSRYRCYTYVHNKKDYSPCHNLIGEVVLGPFIMKYIFNLVRVIDIVKDRDGKITDAAIEKNLLKGEEFEGVAGIVAEDLESIVSTILNKANEAVDSSKDGEVSILDKATKDFEANELKYKRALERLEDLYLFSDDSMPEKDYLIKRNKLEDKLSNLKNEYKSKYETKRKTHTGDMDFLEKATKYLLLENIVSDKASYNDFIKIVDKNIIKAYVNNIIKDISVNGGKVVSVEFTNGMVHRFIYK